MKVNICFVFSAVLLLSACKKEQEPIVEPVIEEVITPGNQEFGWVKGFKNESEWEASAKAVLFDTVNNYLDLIFRTYNQDGFLRESFTVNEIPIIKGIYPIKKGTSSRGDSIVGSSYGRVGSHGDVLSAFYEASDNNPNSSIELINADTTLNLFTGKINNLVFEITLGSFEGQDTVTFNNLEFECRME